MAELVDSDGGNQGKYDQDCQAEKARRVVGKQIVGPQKPGLDRRPKLKDGSGYSSSSSSSGSGAASSLWEE